MKKRTCAWMWRSTNAMRRLQRSAMPRLVRVEERIQPERAARTVAIAASAVTTHVGKSAMSCMLKMFCRRRWSMLRRARARAEEGGTRSTKGRARTRTQERGEHEKGRRREERRGDAGKRSRGWDGGEKKKERREKKNDARLHSLEELHLHVLHLHQEQLRRVPSHHRLGARIHRDDRLLNLALVVARDIHHVDRADFGEARVGVHIRVCSDVVAVEHVAH